MNDGELREMISNYLDVIPGYKDMDSKQKEIIIILVGVCLGNYIINFIRQHKKEVLEWFISFNS